MFLLKALALVSLLAFVIVSSEARPPTLNSIVPSNSSCSFGRKICSGNTICTSSTSGGCCGSCSSTQCGTCYSSETCTGSSCTSTYIIIIGCVFGAIFLFAIVSAIIRTYWRHRNATYSSPATTMVVVQETTPQPVIYKEETVVIAPPAQQPYAPNTYVTTSNPPAYAPNQYGAPQGNVYYSTGGVHENY